MATHSSVLAWRIPGTGEPGGLTSTGWYMSRTRLKRLSSSSSSSSIFCSTEAAPFYIPTKNTQEFQFLHILTNIREFLSFFPSFLIVAILMGVRRYLIVVVLMFFFLKYVFIYLAGPGLNRSMRTLSCGMWDLVP